MQIEYSEDESRIRWEWHGEWNEADLDELIEAWEKAQKRGKWIKIGDCDTVQCSYCLDDFDYVDGLCYLCHGQELPNYCPNCGAKMEENDDR